MIRAGRKAVKKKICSFLFFMCVCGGMHVRVHFGTQVCLQHAYEYIFMWSQASTSSMP